MLVTVLVVLSSLSSDVPAAAEAANGEEPPPSSKLELGGFVDVYMAINANRPADGESFPAGVGSTAKRAGELALNLAGLDVSFEPSPIGARLQLVVGPSTELVHAGEPLAGVVGPQVFNSLYQAYVAAAVPDVEGLTIDAGIFSSHIGFESYFSFENWSYTRGWLAELSPFYQAGVRARYAPPVLPQLSGQILVLNGWQLIGDNNRGKSLGAQLAWDSELLSVALNGLVGPELPGDDLTMRIFGDLVVVLRPTSWIALAVSVDAGYQQNPVTLDAYAVAGRPWAAAAVYARLAPLSWLAVAGRAEHFADPWSAISGAEQHLTEATVTVELTPVEQLSLKAEGRFDHSTADVFSGPELTGVGEPSRVNTQALVVLGAVATF